MSHPLTALAVEELPGWVACSEWLRQVLEECGPMVAAPMLAARVADLQAVAEGLLANSEAGADESEADDTLDEEEAEQAQHGLAEAVAEALPTRRAAAPGLPREHRSPRADSPWTPARLELLHRDYPAGDHKALFAAINKLPGAVPLASIDAMRQRARNDRIERDPTATAEARRQHMRRVVEDFRAKTAAGQNDTGYPPPAPAEEIERARRMFLAGAGITEIATAVGRPKTTVHGWVQRKGWYGQRAAQVAASTGTPEAEPAPPPAPIVTETKDMLRAEAIRRIRIGELRGAREVAEDYGWTLAEAQEITEAARASVEAA